MKRIFIIILIIIAFVGVLIYSGIQSYQRHQAEVALMKERLNYDEYKIDWSDKTKIRDMCTSVNGIMSLKHEKLKEKLMELKKYPNDYAEEIYKLERIYERNERILLRYNMNWDQYMEDNKLNYE